MTAFEIVKDSVDIVDAAGRYGLDVSRLKKALCPYHDDTNPSLSFRGQRFKCFACGTGGDVIDLVGHLANTTPLETVRELNHTYGLRIDLDKPRPTDEFRRRKRLQSEEKALEEWKCFAAVTLGKYFCLLRKWREIYAPKHPDDELDPRFVESLHMLGYIDYISYDVFHIAPGGAMALYKSGFVERIAGRLKKEYDNPSGIVFSFEANEYRPWAA